MLVNCVAYQQGEKVADIDRQDISEHLKQPGSFVWVALYEPDDAELDAMQEQFGLHELAVEDARSGHQRPEDRGVRAARCSSSCTPSSWTATQLHVGEVDIFVGSQLCALRSAAARERGFSIVRARCETEPDLLKHGSGFVLYALMDSVVDRYFPVLDALSDEQERLEDEIFGGGLARRNIEALYDLKRRLMTLQARGGAAVRGGRQSSMAAAYRRCARSQDYFSRRLTITSAA